MYKISTFINRRVAKTLKPVTITSDMVSAEAYDLYTKGTEVFYQDENGNYYEGDTKNSIYAYYVGNLTDLNEYLLWV